MTAADENRLRELAGRLVASGPKASGVSASECHEISDGLVEALDELEKTRRELVVTIDALDELSTAALKLRDDVKRTLKRLRGPS